MKLSFTCLFLAIALFGYASAYPRIVRAVASQPSKVPSRVESTSVSSEEAGAQILQYSNEFNPEENSFVYQYETDNGIKVKGYAKDNKVVVQGSYFVLLPDGNKVPVEYVADENGFQVNSAAVPTPNPIIVKMVAYLKTLPPVKDEEEEEPKSAAGSKGVDV